MRRAAVALVGIAALVGPAQSASSDPTPPAEQPFSRPLTIPPVLRPPAQDPRRIKRCNRPAKPRRHRHRGHRKRSRAELRAQHRRERARRRKRQRRRKRCLAALAREPIDIHMRETAVPLIAGPPTPMWTFNGTFPGPTIRARSGTPVKVRYFNDLPAHAGAMTIHLHGGHDASADDGQPDEFLIRPGANRTYSYPLTEAGRPDHARFIWYHDHRMGLTGRNVWNGLAGMFILDDRVDTALPLPKGRYDVPLMIGDRTFNRDNTLSYPVRRATPNPLSNAVPGEGSPPNDAVVGTRTLVNGGSQPHFDVAARHYRLRILNASNFSLYNLHLSSDADFVQVGTDQGLLPKPVVRKTIDLGPGERADVIVDFHGQTGRQIVLESAPRGDSSAPRTDAAGAQLMLFRVGAGARDGTSVPATLRPLPPLDPPPPAVPTRTWTFGLGYDPSAGPVWTINNRTFDPNRSDAFPIRGASETWQFTNDSTVSHLIHIHDVAFRELSRDGAPPPPGEDGLKDTWILDPGETIVLAAKFTDFTGKFMIHCHMLEHEDHGMMTTFTVVPDAATARRDERRVQPLARRETVRRLRLPSSGPAETPPPTGISSTAERVTRRAWRRILLYCHLGRDR